MWFVKVAFIDLQNLAHASSYNSSLLGSALALSSSIVALNSSCLSHIVSSQFTATAAHHDPTVGHMSSHQSSRWCCPWLPRQGPPRSDLGVRRNIYKARFELLTALQMRAIMLLDRGTLLMSNSSTFSLRRASGLGPIHHWWAATSAMTSPWNSHRVSATQSWPLSNYMA